MKKYILYIGMFVSPLLISPCQSHAAPLFLPSAGATLQLGEPASERSFVSASDRRGKVLCMARGEGLFGLKYFFGVGYSRPEARLEALSNCEKGFYRNTCKVISCRSRPTRGG